MTASPPEPEGNDAQPVWADERVTVVDYDRRWPELGARECHHLHRLLTAWLAGNGLAGQ